MFKLSGPILFSMQKRTLTAFYGNGLIRDFPINGTCTLVLLTMIVPDPRAYSIIILSVGIRPNAGTQRVFDHTRVEICMGPAC